MKTNQKGFTLVELLVVITIIGILAVGGISVIGGARQRARDSVRITDMRALVTTLEQIEIDGVGGGATCGAQGYPEDSSWANLGDKIMTNGYMDKVPEDPVNNAARDLTYNFIASTNCEAFEVSTAFEHQANSGQMTDDLGNDADRFEQGSPNCLGGSPNAVNCADGVGDLDSSDAADAIATTAPAAS